MCSANSKQVAKLDQKRKQLQFQASLDSFYALRYLRFLRDRKIKSEKIVTTLRKPMITVFCESSGTLKFFFFFFFFSKIDRTTYNPVHLFYGSGCVFLR